VQQVPLSQVVRESVVLACFWRRATGALGADGLLRAGAAAAEHRQRTAEARRAPPGPACSCGRRLADQRQRCNRRPTTALLSRQVKAAYERGGVCALELRRALPPKEQSPMLMPRRPGGAAGGKAAGKGQQRQQRQQRQQAWGGVSMDANLTVQTAVIVGGSSTAGGSPRSRVGSPRRPSPGGSSRSLLLLHPPAASRSPRSSARSSPAGGAQRRRLAAPTL